MWYCCAHACLLFVLTDEQSSVGYEEILRMQIDRKDVSQQLGNELLFSMRCRL